MIVDLHQQWATEGFFFFQASVLSMTLVFSYSHDVSTDCPQQTGQQTFSFTVWAIKSTWTTSCDQE